MPWKKIKNSKISFINYVTNYYDFTIFKKYIFLADLD